MNVLFLVLFSASLTLSAEVHLSPEAANLCVPPSGCSFHNPSIWENGTVPSTNDTATIDGANLLIVITQSNTSVNIVLVSGTNVTLQISANHTFFTECVVARGSQMIIDELLVSSSLSSENQTSIVLVGDGLLDVHTSVDLKGALKLLNDTQVCALYISAFQNVFKLTLTLTPLSLSLTTHKLTLTLTHKIIEYLYEYECDRKCTWYCAVILSMDLQFLSRGNTSLAQVTALDNAGVILTGNDGALLSSFFWQNVYIYSLHLNTSDLHTHRCIHTYVHST